MTEWESEKHKTWGMPAEGFIGMTSIVMLRGSYLWKVVGCRNDSSTLVGRMKESAKLATRMKAQKSTGSTIVQNGTKSDEGFLLSENGSKKREHQRMSGRGKEVSSSTLKESQRKRDHNRMEKVGVGEAQKLGHTSRRFQRSRIN